MLRLLLGSFLLASMFCAGEVGATPQANAGLTIGGAAVGNDGAFWDHAEFHMGLRGDVMFGRDRPGHFGFGPFVEVGTFALDELQFGGGATLLMPVDNTLPLVASVGAFGRIGDDDFGLEPGLSGALFWGTRSYNFHANYVMSAGLVLGFRQSLGESKESTLMLAAQLDLAVLGLPLVALINLMRGPTAAAAPIE